MVDALALDHLRVDLQRDRRRQPAHFEPGGQLKAGWRRLQIPERSVDVFEAYAALVLEPLDAPVHWVDSWYYHVAFGGIHCATNCLRRPPQTTPW